MTLEGELGTVLIPEKCKHAIKQDKLCCINRCRVKAKTARQSIFSVDSLESYLL